MKSFNYCLLLLAIVCSSCSKNDTIEDVSIIGEWELTEWRVGLEADINKDGVFNLNLLDEVDCDNSEIITFDADNTISLVIEYNPKIYVTSNENTGDYQFHLRCDEGIIGASSTYVVSNNTIEAFGGTYYKDNNLLIVTTGYAIEVYNEDLTEIIGVLTSEKTYTKL
ncbi:hypothetical protein RM697_01595 [Ichthyenterobacterium sp. W332]|uniref:Lipocalin-like domain-containing protein n=1 Tax=Microcosmobacter mediterraneus TaxID=3075607 RepID=A0ABU2YHE8_9FLAO|nr:hypothetical protein [Ichthyenterobacterium sp. W332]MDT0557321.1 hypothetical protein [Ichthyenterobacterium sp. W332]